MVTELVFVWVLAVVSFFVLWAILAKVVQRITKKKKEAAQMNDETSEDNQSKHTEQ
jgi:flagellar biosynthesis/type III secretory pathway M-ring protein FliF/YscJ